MALTAFDLQQCTMRETIHLNGGPVFFGYVLVCNEHPRLQRIDKCYRKTKKTEIRYRVDGEDVADLDEAADRLNAPPIITDDLRSALEKIGTDYADYRKAFDYSILRKLSDRGLIEWGERGTCRRAALTDTTGGER
jgi:hypothetical protein